MADGAMVSLWRYLVTAAMGVRPTRSGVTVRGPLGDRSLAVTSGHEDGGCHDSDDVADDGDCRASLAAFAELGSAVRPVRVSLSDGVTVACDETRFAELRSTASGGAVFRASAVTSAPGLEGSNHAHPRLHATVPG
jgi:uncharacterized protein